VYRLAIRRHEVLATGGYIADMTQKIAKVVTITRLHEPSSDVKYWLSRPLAERIGAVTELRHSLLGVSDAPGRRLQRVHRVLTRT
jgi:hypothetical protein